MIGCLLKKRLRAKCKGLGIIPKSPRVRTAAVLANLPNPSFLRSNAALGTVVAFLLVIGFLYLLFRPYKESSTLKVDAKKVVSAK